MEQKRMKNKTWKLGVHSIKEKNAMEINVKPWLNVDEQQGDKIFNV